MQIPPTLGVPLARQHPNGVIFTPNDMSGFTRYSDRRVSEISAPTDDSAHARVVRAHEICHAVSSPQRVAWYDDHSFFALQATEDLHVHALFISRGLTTRNPAFCRDCKCVYYQELRNLQSVSRMVSDPTAHPFIAHLWPQLVLMIVRAESLDLATLIHPLQSYPFRRQNNFQFRRSKMRDRTRKMMEASIDPIMRTSECKLKLQEIMKRHQRGKNQHRTNLRHTCKLIDQLISMNPWLTPKPSNSESPDSSKPSGSKPSGRKGAGKTPKETELLKYFPTGTTYEVDPDLRVIIIRPPLTQPTTERLRARTRASRSGTKIRFRGLLNRLIDPSSNSPLYRKRSREFAGSIMIDYSGSMPLDTESLTEFCESLPFGTIRYYYGPSPSAWWDEADGIIVEWARDGKRADAIYHRCSTGNCIDASAYELLMRDSGPRFFVDDDGACGSNFDNTDRGYRMTLAEFAEMRQRNSENGIVHHINVDSIEAHDTGLSRMEWAIKKIRSLLP